MRFGRYEAEELLRKEGCSADVIAHCEAVSAYASLVSQRAGADSFVTSLGALLHDIGRGKTHGIEHGIIGAEILRSHAIDERIVLCVERHVGAGISAREARLLGLPEKNYLPETLEEKIVCMADSLMWGKNRVAFEKLLSHYENLSLHDSIERFRKMHGELQKFL